MLNQKKQKRAQIKVSKTETVLVRLDPKLNYFADLSARKHRDSLSSFIRRVVEKKLKTFQFKENDELSAAEFISHIWNLSEEERLIQLAAHYPDLLTYPEEVLLKKIKRNRQADQTSQTET